MTLRTGIIAALAAIATAGTGLVTYPEDPRGACRDPRAFIYAGCLAQRDLLAEAHATALAEGKTLLVAFGASWCYWCRALDVVLHGEVPDDADAEEWALIPPLGAQVARDFVLVHIDGEAEDGLAVLEETGAMVAFPWEVPYLFTVDAEGRFDQPIFAKTAAYERGETHRFALPALAALLEAAARGETLRLPIRDQRGRVRLGVTGWEWPRW